MPTSSTSNTSRAPAKETAPRDHTSAHAAPPRGCRARPVSPVSAFTTPATASTSCAASRSAARGPSARRAALRPRQPVPSTSASATARPCSTCAPLARRRRARGWELAASLLLDPADPEPLATVQRAGPARPEDNLAELYPAVHRRPTRRYPIAEKGIPDAVQDAFSDAARGERAHLASPSRGTCSCCSSSSMMPRAAMPRTPAPGRMWPTGPASARSPLLTASPSTPSAAQAGRQGPGPRLRRQRASG